MVIGCADPNTTGAGGGMARLQAAGVSVECAENPAPFRELIRPFAVSSRLKRPYVCLKWAETVNGVLGQRNGPRILISSAPANRFVHRLRAQLPGIMTGRETLALDNPRLSLRLQPGPQPTRIIWDSGLSLPPERHVFRPEGQLIVLNELRDGREGHIHYVKTGIQDPANHLADVLATLYERFQLGGILVEGGRQLLSSFLAQGVWDDLYVIQAPHRANGDVLRPELPANLEPLGAEDLPPDRLLHYRRDAP